MNMAINYEDLTKKEKKLYDAIVDVSGYQPYLFDDGTVEISTYTGGGVNQVIYLEDFTMDALDDYIFNFDIDYEIDILRQAEDYREAFTISQSLDDFKSWLEMWRDYVSEIRKEVNR